MSEEFSAAQESISVLELAAWRAQGLAHTLLDVREAPELAICKLENARHIPMGQVPPRVSELPQDIPLVVLCHRGARSLRVVQFLRNAGLGNAINLEGGIDAWAAQVDTGIRRY